jgi:hypothetical protein
VIGLLSPMPTSRNTRSEPSIEAWWRHLGKWQDANFKCSERTWRLVVVNKSYKLNEPSWKFCESQWNPAIGAFLFFSLDCVLLGVFFFGSSASWFDLWSKMILTYFFPLLCKNTGLKQIVH